MSNLIGKPILELQNSSKWRLFYDERIIAAPAPAENSWVPIPDRVVPVQLDSHIIVVKNVVQGNDYYKRVGRLVKQIQLGLAPNVESTQKYRIWQNQHQLFIFNEISTTYSLKLEFDWWVRNCHITLWEYTGKHSDNLTEGINAMGDSIEELKTILGG